MDYSLNDMHRLMHNLFVNYWDFTMSCAIFYTRGNYAAAEELAMTAFEQTWSCMQHHPGLVIERPQWWFKKTIDNCYQNTRRSKLQSLTWSLEQLQENRRPDTEELTFEIAAPPEYEPEHVLMAKEREAEQKVRHEQAILATDLDEQTKRFAILHIVDGLSFLEIAHANAVQPRLVERAVRKCLKELRQTHGLQEVEQEEGKE